MAVLLVISFRLFVKFINCYIEPNSLVATDVSLQLEPMVGSENNQ